jgi:N4-gp56 family major capsid protein
MPDTFLSTATTNFDKSTVVQILKQTQELLRAGLPFTPKGSVIPATYIKGTNGTFRSFSIFDQAAGGETVITTDADADPFLEDLDMDYVEFTAARALRGIGLTDHAQKLSPFDLKAIAAERTSRSVALYMDGVAKALYAGAGGDLFAGTSNTQTSDVAAGDVITADLLKDAVALLRGQDVKPLSNGLYAFVASPYVIRDLTADSDFINEIRHADPESLLTGEVARYAGASIVDAGSNAIVRADGGTGSIDVHASILIGAGALFAGLGDVEVFMNFGSDKGDPWARRDSITWKAFAGGVVNDLQAQRFLTIESAASLA